MERKIIAVDMDEVISDTTIALLARFWWKINNIKISLDELWTPELWKIKKLKITKNKSIWIYFWFLICSVIWNRIETVKWAKKELSKLKDRWYKIYVVTARHHLLRWITMLWLWKKYRGMFAWIRFADFFTKWATKKSIICKELWATVMVEDNLDNAINCAESWIKVFLIDRPWNQNYDKKKHKWIIKVKGWSEIKI